MNRRAVRFYPYDDLDLRRGLTILKENDPLHRHVLALARRLEVETRELSTALVSPTADFRDFCDPILMRLWFRGPYPIHEARIEIMDTFLETHSAGETSFALAHELAEYKIMRGSTPRERHRHLARASFRS
jgi:hypothetical protein